MKCENAASGCNYPKDECFELCMKNIMQQIPVQFRKKEYPVLSELLQRQKNEFIA